MPLVVPIWEIISRLEQRPVCDGVLIELLIYRDVCNAMQVVLVEVVRGD